MALVLITLQDTRDGLAVSFVTEPPAIEPLGAREPPPMSRQMADDILKLITEKLSRDEPRIQLLS